MSESLPSRKHRPKTRLSQNTRHLRPPIPLDFDSALFDGAPRPASLLHRFGQLLFFRQPNADKASHDGHGFATSMRRLPDDINAPTILLCRWRRLARPANAWLRSWRKPFAI